jgi:hypothetical protein
MSGIVHNRLILYWSETDSFPFFPYSELSPNVIPHWKIHFHYIATVVYNVSKMAKLEKGQAIYWVKRGSHDHDRNYHRK